jgi:hypothetical protein
MNATATAARPAPPLQASVAQPPIGRRAALALTTAAPVLLTAIVLRPERAGDSAEMFTAVASARGLELASSALFVVGAALLAAGAVGAGALVRSLGSRLGWTGSLLLAAGAGWFVVRAFSGLQLYAVTDPALPRAESLAFYVETSGTAGFAVMLPLLLAFIPAPIVLGLGLRRVGVVPTAAVAIYAVGLVIFLALETHRIGEAIGFALMSAAIGWYGLALARAARTQAAHD